MASLESGISAGIRSASPLQRNAVQAHPPSDPQCAAQAASIGAMSHGSVAGYLLPSYQQGIPFSAIPQFHKHETTETGTQKLKTET